MEKNEQEERFKRALEKEDEAKAKIGYWAEIVGLSGIIIGVIVGAKLNEVFGGLICLGTLIIWMKMKHDSGGK